MTIRVMIVHADPATERNLRIRQRGKGSVLDSTHTILKPGESTELTVHSANELVLEEEPLVAQGLEEPATT